MSKTVIVTGGCGYIGSHVSRAFKLADPENKVYVVDWKPREHTTRDVDGFLFDDFASPACLRWIEEIQPDVIVHCAGTSLVGPSMIFPADYYDNNVAKTIKLLNWIKHFAYKPSFIFSSSAAVYGNPQELPIPETHVVSPISPYGNTKAIIETIFKDYANAYDINSVCFRYFNAAGAWPETGDLGQEPGATHIIARALEASLSGHGFVLNGNDYDTADGTCVRDYIHVVDLATAHIKAVEYMDAKPGAHIFNLGTNSGISNQEIIDYISKNYGLSIINVGPRRAGDPDELIADATKARNQLTWVPEHSTIESIITDAYKWYRNQQGI